MVKRVSRSIDGAASVDQVAHRRTANHGFGGGVDHVFVLACRQGNPLTVDEESVELGVGYWHLGLQKKGEKV